MRSTEPVERPLCIAFAGRLTGPKGRLARRLATEVFGHFPRSRFLVVGGPLDDETQATVPTNVEFTGQRPGLEDTFAEADLILGSGRVALEALRAGVPVYAIGEACRVGFVDTDSFAAAARTNFGDCEHDAVVDPEVIIRDLERFHAGFRPEMAGLASQLARYGGDKVAAAVEQSYLDARIERRLGSRSLPVLCYHRVVPEPPADPGPNIHVTTAMLAGHLRQLRLRGMRTITFSDLLGEGPLPRRPVMLTFDDGYQDNHRHLLPLLEHFDARAVIFALADRSLATNAWDAAYPGPAHALMNAVELRACHDSGRVEIASHGLTHEHMPQLPPDALARETQDSKHRLEDLIGTSVCSFAYPYGEWGPRERDAVEAAGYAFGVATDQGQPLLRDRFAIARRIVFPGTGRFGFYKKTSRWYPRYRRLLGRG